MLYIRSEVHYYFIIKVLQSDQSVIPYVEVYEEGKDIWKGRSNLFQGGAFQQQRC